MAQKRPTGVRSLLYLYPVVHYCNCILSIHCDDCAHTLCTHATARWHKCVGTPGCATDGPRGICVPMSIALPRPRRHLHRGGCL